MAQNGIQPQVPELRVAFSMVSGEASTVPRSEFLMYGHDEPFVQLWYATIVFSEVGVISEL